MAGSGIRLRLAATLVALVILTVAAIGVGTYAFVDARLRASLLDDTRRQAQFDLSVLLPGQLPPGADRATFMARGLPAAFALRGDADLIVDFGDGDPYVSRASLLSVFAALPASIRDVVAAGHLGFAWVAAGDGRWLVVGGTATGGPTVYLVVNRAPIDDALIQLRVGLVVAGFIAIAIALVAARFAARRILRPIGAASEAAARIGEGDLTARVPVEGRDEFAAWAEQFNRMAASLESTVLRLESAQRQNRRFVADVSHELRTPLAALVTEASLIEAGLDGMGPDARSAAELLVADVRRLRVLVDDLMELSRFDADAERLQMEPVDLARLVRATVATRLPEASVEVETEPMMIESDIRRLDRILGNLLDNARVHASGSQVEVRVLISAGTAEVVVSDRGPGVNQEYLARLFDRFFKAEPSRAATSQPTSGLGLAIVAEHVALLGGSVTSALREGGGLDFTVRLPVAGSLRDGDGPETYARETPTLSEPASRNEP